VARVGDWACAGMPSVQVLIRLPVGRRCSYQWFRVTRDIHGFWERDAPMPEQSVTVTSVAAGKSGRCQLKYHRHTVSVGDVIDVACADCTLR
jgi:hypothetical protein